MECGMRLPLSLCSRTPSARSGPAADACVGNAMLRDAKSNQRLAQGTVFFHFRRNPERVRKLAGLEIIFVRILPLADDRGDSLAADAHAQFAAENIRRQFEN